jgi:hydrogenase maturation protease
MDNKIGKIAVLAIGEIGLRDAGTGLYLLDLLGQIELPKHVDLYSCTPSMDVLGPDLRQYTKIIILTAHEHGDAAGEIMVVSIASDLSALIRGLPRPLQPAGPRLQALFESIPSDGNVEWILIGIEPKSVSPGTSISDDVIKAAPKALSFLGDLLAEPAPK